MLDAAQCHVPLHPSLTTSPFSYRQVLDLQSLLRQSHGGAHALPRGLANGSLPAVPSPMPAFLPHPSQLTQHHPRMAAGMQFAVPPFPEGLGLR